MTIAQDAVRDGGGHVMFHCSRCRKPMTADDIFELGMRLPDDGESRDDYLAAELLDEVNHADCARAERRG